MRVHRNVKQALEILPLLGLPRAQQNERSALCLLALLDLTRDKCWSQATNPLMGITPIMDWARKHYRKDYAPNTRETVRRQTMHQFVMAGLVRYNPDEPNRPVNSPKAVYQVEDSALSLLKCYGAPSWEVCLKKYLAQQGTLIEKFARERGSNLIPVQISPGKSIQLTPGEHSELIKAVIENFGPLYAPGGVLVYAGDTGNKWGYFDEVLLKRLGVVVDVHGKMPDVVIYHPQKEWLFLIEAVTSHGPVDPKRHEELEVLFSKATAGLVYVTAFPDRSVMARYLCAIAWETEVWVAEAPSHLIHFNGERFLGPYVKG